MEDGLAGKRPALQPSAIEQPADDDQLCHLAPMNNEILCLAGRAAFAYNGILVPQRVVGPAAANPYPGFARERE